MKTEATIKKQIKELYAISQNAPSDIKVQAAYYAEALTWVIENPRWSCVLIVEYRLTEKPPEDKNES